MKYNRDKFINHFRKINKKIGFDNVIYANCHLRNGDIQPMYFSFEECENDYFYFIGSNNLGGMRFIKIYYKDIKSISKI